MSCLVIGVAGINGRIAPSSNTAEKDKRGTLSGSYEAPSSLSSSSSYESPPSYSVSPSQSYGPSSSSSYSTDSSHSISAYNSPDYSNSNSGFKPIRSQTVEQPSSSFNYGHLPAAFATPYTSNTNGILTGLLPSPGGLDYSSLSYASLGGLGSPGGHAYSGFGSVYPYSALSGFNGGLGASQHYAHLMPVTYGGIGASYVGVPIDYSSLAAAPIAPVSLTAYPSVHQYASNLRSLSSSYTPNQYPSYSSNSFSGSSLSSYSDSKPYSSNYATSSDYTSPSKYSSSNSPGYSSGYSSPSGSGNTFTAPPYSRYPSSGSSSSYSSLHKNSPHSKESYNF